MSYQAQPPADGAQPRPRWPPRAREEPARAYETDDPSTDRAVEPSRTVASRPA